MNPTNAADYRFIIEPFLGELGLFVSSESPVSLIEENIISQFESCYIVQLFFCFRLDTAEVAHVIREKIQEDLFSKKNLIQGICKDSGSGGEMSSRPEVSLLIRLITSGKKLLLTYFSRLRYWSTADSLQSNLY